MSIRTKFEWYRHRLGAMSMPEILHRVKEALKRKQDSYLSSRLLPAATDYGVLPVLPNLRQGLTAWDVPTDLLNEWKKQAQRATNGEFEFLGMHWPHCAPGAKWHMDPETTTKWPSESYCFAIDFRHATAKGDVKYVWELNRLQYLHNIAALAFKEKDVALASFCLAEIESWIDSNPPFFGVNWASGIELALRTLSILIVTSLLGEQATPAQRKKIWQTLETHAIWLERYPSLFSSANNHRTSEGLGLFLIGALCPAFGRSAYWRDEGWKILCDTIQKQILADGIGAEQSISYAAAVLEIFLLGLQVAKANNMTVPEFYQQRLVKAAECLRWFTDEGGHQPHIGDNDNSRIIGGYSANEEYISSILNALSVATQQENLVSPWNGPHLRQAIFGFAVQKAQAVHGVKTFEKGGYTVGRYQSNNREILLAMDHGYLGYLSIAAHGHADALAIWLHIGDQPVLVDAGNYLYHSGGEWRSYFRSTAAHNTLNVEHTDSSTMSGNFNWSYKANSTLVSKGEKENGWWVEAQHEGYKEQFGVLHRRSLQVRPEHGFFIEDSVIGDEGRQVEINFLLHPAVDVAQKEDAILITKKRRTASLH